MVIYLGLDGDRLGKAKMVTLLVVISGAGTGWRCIWIYALRNRLSASLTIR